VLVAPLTDTDVVEGLASIGVPLVAISADPDRVPAEVASIDVDNVAGIEMAVRHLRSLGHRRIAHLMGDPNVASVAIRRAAFQSALVGAGIPCPAEYVTSCTYDAHTVPEAVRALLARPDRPTAIVAGNDKIAIAAVAAARAAGVIVPAQLSVVGFDDIEAASHLTPTLTTIRQPLAAIGEAAAHYLIRGLEGDPAVFSQHRLIEPILIVRESTAVPYAGQ
jgi:LacI family transcriptional regulator